VAEAVAGAVVLEVAGAVAQRGVRAGDERGSAVALGERDEDFRAELGAGGLPLEYDRAAIQAYWDDRPGELNSRWVEFVRQSVPLLSKGVSLALTGGVAALQRRERELARDATGVMERLGPTYVKVGQMMSIRPDVFPPAALEEFGRLQDAVPPFSSDEARACLAQELGRPLEEVFSELSEDPVASASLAQVYKGVLRDSGRSVAVKVQRPGILDTVSKDLYVLRRASEVYQGLMDRFVPQQETDYVSLLNEWAVGFYTELDFLNEARNQQRFRDEVMGASTGVYIPEVFSELCTRRVLVTEWVDGVKLSECSTEEVRELSAIGQRCFLVQLLDKGLFHGDPHPGNLLKLNDLELRNRGYRLTLLDFGLVAEVTPEDRATMTRAVVHTANRDFAGIVTVFEDLGFLREGVADRGQLQGLTQRVLSPYLYGGGGASGLMKELEGTPGGFQALTQDLLTAMSDIPFSVPPYFALLARSVAILEGIALTGDPEYKMVLEAYPFVARKLLAQAGPGDDGGLQAAVRGLIAGSGGRFEPRRLGDLLAAAMGDTSAFLNTGKTAEEARDTEGTASSEHSLQEQVGFVLGPEGSGLRQEGGALEELLVTSSDLLVRRTVRLAAQQQAPGGGLLPNFITGALAGPLSRGSLVGALPAAVLVPTSDGGWAPALAPSMREAIDMAAPQLTPEDEVYAKGLSDLLSDAAGLDMAGPAGGLGGSGQSLDVAQVLQLGQRVVQQLAGRGQAGSTAAAADGRGDLAEAFAALGKPERAALEELTARVSGRLRQRVAARLAPLLGAGAGAAVPAPAEALSAR